jgi:hypothetical protein
VLGPLDRCVPTLFATCPHKRLILRNGLIGVDYLAVAVTNER